MDNIKNLACNVMEGFLLGCFFRSTSKIVKAQPHDTYPQGKLKRFLAILFILYTVPTPVSIAQTPSVLEKHPSTNPLQILATTSETLTARFTLPEIQVRNSRQPSVVNDQQEGVGSPENLFTDSQYTEIYFEGADWTLDVGKPRLPIYIQRIGIPIIGTPIVTVIQARPEIKNH